MSEAADSGAEERRVLGRCPETSGFTLETTLGQMAPPKKWTPLNMLPESGSIPWKLTRYLPSTRLQGGEHLRGGQ